MKILIYGVLMAGSILVFISTLKRPRRDVDTKIDLAAYGFMMVGFALLFVTCIAEAIHGGPFF